MEPLFTQAGYQPLEIGFSPSGRQAVPFGIMVTDVYMRDVFPHRPYHIVERMAASHRLLEVEDEMGFFAEPVPHGPQIGVIRRPEPHHIFLREPDSVEELGRFGVTKPEIILAADPALTLAAAPESEVDALLERAGIAPGTRCAGFALRLWPGFSEKASELARLARYLHEKYGLVPVFIPINHKNDSEAAEQVARLIPGVPHAMLPGPLPPAMAIGVLGRMELAVSMRLHGLIFAAGQGTPVVGVSYDPKVTAFLRCIDGECIALSDAGAENLYALADRAIAKRAAPEALAESVRQLRGLEERNRRAAARLLNKEV